MTVSMSRRPLDDVLVRVGPLRGKPPQKELALGGFRKGNAAIELTPGQSTGSGVRGTRNV